jgi:hypothetical protein
MAVVSAGQKDAEVQVPVILVVLIQAILAIFQAFDV